MDIGDNMRGSGTHISLFRYTLMGMEGNLNQSQHDVGVCFMWRVRGRCLKFARPRTCPEGATRLL